MGGIFGAWALDCEGSGMASISSVSPGTMATATPWLTTRAGSYQRNIASDPYGRQHPAAVRLFRLSKVTVDEPTAGKKTCKKQGRRGVEFLAE